jgi:hypothetical protein
MFPGSNNSVLGAARFTTAEFTKGGVILRIRAASSICFVVRSRGKYPNR